MSNPRELLTSIQVLNKFVLTSDLRQGVAMYKCPDTLAGGVRQLGVEKAPTQAVAVGYLLK